MIARARGLRAARGTRPRGVRQDSGSGRRYVLAGGGHTETDSHLKAERRPKVDRPGGRGRGVRRAGTVGGSPGDPAPCDRRRAVSAHVFPPFVTTSVSGPAGPGAGGRAPPARPGAALPHTRPGPRRPPPAALTRAGAGRGHTAEDAPGTALPSGATAGTPRGSSGRPGGRCPAGSRGTRGPGAGGRGPRGRPASSRWPGPSRRSRRRAERPGRSLVLRTPV